MPIIELKNIPKLPVSFWNRIGQLAIQWIRADAKDGLMQNDTSHTYRSEQYKKYKRNDMRRYTKGEGKVFSDAEGYFFGKTYFNNKKAKTKKGTNHTTGDRLEGYKGVSLASNQTSFVDMTLTGRMFRGLHVVKADNISVTLGYRSEDRMKVIGNRDKYNRDVANLNADNRAKVKQAILEQFNENIRKELKDITINVRF